MPVEQSRAAPDDRDPISIRLLGTFALRIGPGKVPLPPNAERLVAYLALERRWTPRLTVATTLWPGLAPARAAGNLRSTLWRVTRAAGRVIVAAREHSLGLDDDIDIDAVRVERRARQCAVPGTPGPEPSDVDLFSVDLLPSWTEEWVLIHRECFRQLRLSALEGLCAHHRRAGQLRQAMHLALTAVSAEPLRESAHRQLVEVHLAEGNVAEAVRQYEVYRRMLRRQLGLLPSPVMRRLVAPLLACPARPV